MTIPSVASISSVLSGSALGTSASEQAQNLGERSLGVGQPASASSGPGVSSSGSVAPGGVQSTSGVEATTGPEGGGIESAAGSESGGFGGALTNAISSLEQTQQNASSASQALASGTLSDPESAVVTVEEAQLAMQLASQIRTKGTEAVQQILQTQV